MARVALVVTSDSVYRGVKEDRVTPLVRERLARSGHELVYSRVVPNEKQVIEEAIREACSRARVVLVTGGTGISPRDVSVDVVRSMSTREVPGFGELHRRLSFEKIGARAALSRASAFIVGECFVAVSPGNPDAVEVALDILEGMVDHIVEQLEGKPHG